MTVCALSQVQRFRGRPGNGRVKATIERVDSPNSIGAAHHTFKPSAVLVPCVCTVQCRAEVFVRAVGLSGELLPTHRYSEGLHLLRADT